MDASFLSGVIEGFYGRPWTQDQRVSLFDLLKEYAFNTYVYAPKDDLKHRMSWRDLYNYEEEEQLRILIREASTKDQIFVYALSPGIDIRYSDEEDQKAICAKLDQVRSLGCDSFALLFDDIPKAMSDKDKKAFDSFAHAQVHVTNIAFDTVPNRVFMFCPTEYCSSRAIPSLKESEYLDTIGKHLFKDIHVMWTGPRVVSRYLTEGHMREVGKVLRRKPLIWDNYFANDYDMRRLHMGPLVGRDLNIRNVVSGFLLNPNNKHEMNFVPIVTTAIWKDADDEYEASDAFRIAAKAWLPQFEKGSSNIPTVKPQRIQDIQEAMDIEMKSSAPSKASSEVSLSPAPMDAESRGPIDIQDISAPVPLPVTAVDELASAFITAEPQTDRIDPKVIVNSLVPEYNECTVLGTPIAPVDAEPMELDSGEAHGEKAVKQITIDDVHLLGQLFYLPFDFATTVELFFTCLSECLRRGVEADEDTENSILNGYWKKTSEFVTKYNEMYWRLLNCSNKSLLSELLPYLWDTHGLLAVTEGLLSWIEKNNQTNEFHIFWEKDHFDGFCGEPWMTDCPTQSFSYTLTDLLGVTDEVTQLLRNKSPLPVAVRTFYIQLVESKDTKYMHLLFGTQESKTKNEMLFDRHFHMFETHKNTPIYNFIAYEKCLDANAPADKFPHCAVAAIPNIVQYIEESWPEFYETMLSKYRSMKKMWLSREQKKLRTEIASWKPATIDSCYQETYPAQMFLYAKCNTDDSIPAKRIIQTMAAALAINGVPGVYILADPDDEARIIFLQKLGFSPLWAKHDSEDKRLRIFALNLGKNARFARSPTKSPKSK